MALLPKVKLKALVSFPANVTDGVGIDVVKANGNYQFDIAFDDFAPPVEGLTDPDNQTLLVWNLATDSYVLAPVSLFGAVAGSIPSDVPPLMDGSASAGSSPLYARGDHVHPSDTTKADAAHDHPAADITDFSEAVDFRVKDLLVAGANVTLTYSDILNSLTIASTGGGGGGTPSNVNPIMDGTAAPGVGTDYSRFDHVHPSDTTKQAADADLTQVAGLTGTGIARRTATTPTWTVGTAVANSELATMAAFTLKANNTSGAAVPTDITIAGLTNKAVPAGADLLLISDSAASNAFKQITISSLPAAVPSTIAVVNDVAETTAFIGFFVDATGNLQPKTNANMTFNALSGVVTFASSVLTITDINGGTMDDVAIGAATPDTAIFTTAIANSFVPNSATVPTNGMYLPAANTLGWSINSAAEMQLTGTALSPAVDGGQSLGTTLLGWQNLFANTGFVLNIEGGNWVATHTSGILTVGTGDLQITTAGTSANSVVTRTGTQTLTGKTFDANGTGNSITNIETPDIAPAALITAAEGIGANNVDTAWPTSAAVIAYAQPKDTTLDAFAAYNSAGLITQTAADTFIGRTLTAPAAGFTITNPAGALGNPTFVLADDLAALEALAGTNTIYYRSAANTWTAVTIGSNLTFTGGTLAASSGTATVGDGDYGDIVVSGTGTIYTIDAGVVTYAKMQNVSAASKLLGRGDSGSGSPQEITLGAGLAMTGTTLSSSGGAGAPASAQYVTLAVDGTLTAERVLTPGAGLTMTDGGAGSTITLDVGAGTGITVNANDIALTIPVAVTSGGTGQITAPLAVGNLINACSADTTPDPAADFIGTYDLSGLTGKKITINDLITAAEAQIETVIDTLANLTSIQGRTITLADAGADAFLAWDDSASAYQNLSAADAVAIISGTNTFQLLDADLTSWALITRASGFDTFATTPTSANLAALVTNETGTGLLAFATSPQLTTPQIQDASSTHQYIFAASELVANRTITLPLLTAGDTFVFEAHTQTLTNKTLNLTSNTLSGTTAQFNTANSDADFYVTGGTDVALADGGTGNSLTDPGADRVMFWDDSAGLVTWLTMGTNLTITGTTLDAAAGSVSLASTTEVLTGTDTAKAVTPDALAALWEKGTNVASAATISLGEGGYFHITGTVTITDIDFATAKDGRLAVLVFDGILTLTHNATTLILPGGASITTAAGDSCIVIQDAADNVKVVAYTRASGIPIAEAVPSTITVANEAADAACFVLFTQNATGNEQPKTNANFTFDAATNALWVSTLNLGGAADATLARVGAGDVSVEGQTIYRVGGTDVAATDGGTGQSSYAVGDLLYASTTTALSKLADVATGNALISGGVNTAPAYGKIGLTTHVSGILPVANGGTGQTSPIHGFFHVHRNSVNQSGGSISAGNNKVQFTTETADINSYFDNATNYRYLPTVAGRYFIILVVAASYATSTNDSTQAMIFKNGTALITGNYIGVANTQFYSSVFGAIAMNGSSDYIEGYAYLPASPTAIFGQASLTFMIGWRIGD